MRNAAPRAGRGDPFTRHSVALSKKRNGTRPALLGAPAPVTSGVVAPRKLQCFSVACNDMPQLEFGDKIVLPAKVLLELQCFKVATPMLFHIRAFGAQEQDESGGFTQYCSVQEFSAPDGQVFIPYWMMLNLHITEGSDVVITNVVDIPRGIYCRLQPEDTSFLDIAAEIGPKLLMESALRRYSVLSKHETILIDHGDKRFYVKVLELKPGHVVSLLGDVDLELDFAAPPQSDPKRPKSAAESGEANQQLSDEKLHQRSHLDASAEVASEDVTRAIRYGVGRRLIDGACVIAMNPTSTPAPETVSVKKAKLGYSSFQAAKQRIGVTGASNNVATDRVADRADTDSLAKDIKLAQGAFTSQGHQLGGRIDKGALSTARPMEGGADVRQRVGITEIVTTQSTQFCVMCLSEVAEPNAALHAVRCAKNPSYHKFECAVCHARVLKRDQAMHIHCDECNELVASESCLTAHVEATHAATSACVDCGARFTQAGLAEHRRSACPQALELCTLCGFRLKRKEIAAHMVACSSRTERCEVCHKYIKIIDMDSHMAACSSDNLRLAGTITFVAPSNNQVEENSSASAAVGLECVYCGKRAFVDARLLERHVNQECLVARAFRAPASCTKSTNDPAASSVKTLIQGKLRRLEDAKLLSESSSSISFDTSQLHEPSSSNQNDTSAHCHRADSLIRDDHSARLTASTLHGKRKHKPARPPKQLASLPSVPAQPNLPRTEVDVGLFIGSTATASRASTTSASTHSLPRQQQPHARAASTTRKLQAIRRPQL